MAKFFTNNILLRFCIAEDASVKKHNDKGKEALFNLQIVKSQDVKHQMED
jgi:hypothetical protein